jgi:hypothetical protein
VTSTSPAKRVPIETDWENAPSVLQGARTLQLTPEECGLDYWIEAVAGQMLQGLVHGHVPDAAVPDHMRKEGPLRDAIIAEFAFRSLVENKAVRTLPYLLTLAPDNASLEFFVTQIFDEARHAATFRGHLPELGVPEAEVDALIDQVAGPSSRAVLDPLEQFAMTVLAGPEPFYNAVVVLTVLVEGVLAPAAELSERKWHVLNPAAASIERGASMDELRHLTVASEIVRRFLMKHPYCKPLMLDVLTRGFELWQELLMAELLMGRETAFQAGLAEHAELLADYEIWPGRRLLDTTPEERVATAARWSEEIQRARLKYMGLAEATA